MSRLAIKTGTYQKDGETKNRYTRLGVLKQGENGPYLLIDPSVDLAGCFALQQKMDDKYDSVMVSVFDDSDQKSKEGFSDKIPF